MQSKHLHLKPTAIQMRYLGNSIKTIEKSLGIPRSTLSGWFRKIMLTSEQLTSLKNAQLKALKKARIKATLWHNQQKSQRIKTAEKQAQQLLNSIDLQNKAIQELAIAMLYLGEGFKKNQLGIGSSSPLILRFFMHVYLNNFNVKKDSLRCELHLRADQNPDETKKYWAKELGIPLKSFTYVTFDKRTKGSKTFDNYNGVCSLICGNIAAQRKLLYIAETYCKKIVNG